MNKIKSIYGLPKKVIFCNKCVISNQRPSSTIEFKSSNPGEKKGINFEDDGVCSACKFHSHKEKNIDWSKREKKLLELLDKYRKNDGSYDVIVPGSGGKDSSFTAHILKYKYGMNPLTVTWAPHLYTDIGWNNFTNWMHVGGLDNLLYTPNGKLHSLLTRLAFKNLLHPFQPFIIGQRLIGPSIASKFGVNLIMYGENQAEYGNNVKDNKHATRCSRKQDRYRRTQEESLTCSILFCYLSCAFQQGLYLPFCILYTNAKSMYTCGSLGLFVHGRPRKSFMYRSSYCNVDMYRCCYDKCWLDIL